MGKRQPNLNRKLAHTIKPVEGPAAQLETLASASAAISIANRFITAKTRSPWGA
jgi:hypothetical protein